MAIFQKQGYWWIDYRCNGKRYREKISPNYKVAKQAYENRKASINKEKFDPALCRKPPVKFQDMANEFWKLHGQYKRGVSYPYMLEKVKEHFKDKTLKQITVPLALDYINGIREATSVSNANRYHTFMRSIFSRAIEWERFDGVNPFSKIRQGREPQHRLRFLSKEEIARLLSACSPRIYPIVACAVFTGLRRGEILRLTWETVDLNQNVLYVLESKSDKPREVPIPPKLATMFEGLRGDGRIGKLFDVSEDVLHVEFRRAVGAAAIQEFRFHDLRHTFASHFVMRTNDLPTLQKLLGHHSPAMTQRYAHLSKGHLQIGMLTFDAGMDVLPKARTEEFERVDA